MKTENKRLKKQFQETPRALGVFLIRNTTDDRIFLGPGIDLRGTINRHRFQLTNGSHPNKELQRDWARLGPDKFAFEILEELMPRNEPSFDARRELEFMEEMWLEKLSPFDERGYNQKKLSRDQKLARIAKSQRAKG
jgi:hypothetical protein